VVRGLIARATERSRSIGLHLAFAQARQADVRVLLLFWHLADRWGRVGANGTVVPVRLTHEMIGRLVGAHRPSVTSALGELQRDGAITRQGGGWLLHGDPPEQVENGWRIGTFTIDPGFATAIPVLAAGLLG
jgi:CRP-like cAMP-binding protein